ncbi:MAG: sigma-70 family RNA polymerase sigma factor [Alteromonadaceae bacterium]|nr:sigma-70 family RNA polymerase sigma factor [Alteromonadaceae bacterium]
MQLDPDQILLKEYVNGDLAAFTTLYNKHKSGSYRYFLRQVGTPELAEDLLQDLWGKVIVNAGAYANDAKFTTWLYRIARNLLIDKHRHLNVAERYVDKSVSSEESQHATPQDEFSESPEWNAAQAIQKSAILDCLAKLPQVQRDGFLLREEAGLDQNQIADVVGASVEAVKSRMRYAISNLRECLSRLLEGDVNGRQ